MAKTVILMMDSFGIGGAKDAAAFGDAGANTFLHIAHNYPEFGGNGLSLPNLETLGLANAGELASGVRAPLVSGLAKMTLAGRCKYGCMEEISAGKDTISGHWEMAGVPVRHITAGRNVPMYDTSIECRSAGAFHSTMVVSMRGIPSTQVADACRISGYYPSVHGAPVCVGDPSAIGIDDIMHPDYGDAPVLEPGDVPVFWACGVTPQAAVMASKPTFAITHAPGHMFITDVPDRTYMV